MKKVMEKAMIKASHLGSLNQFIQMRIWEYADTSQKERKAMDVADVIIKECFKIFNKLNK